MTTTFLRTPETEARYFAQRKLRMEQPDRYPPFSPTLADALREFDHWFIVENDFPYDAIATTHHLIFTKRHIPFEWALLNQAERDELEHLKKTVFATEYEVLYENLPKGQTVPTHFHLHLLILKRSSS
ncbi:MAG: HIT domain-containing protein [Candidatus Pacebacteria bacterium]|nr:HIT domain-containing protein [Candidatus Paceibacterota bacterium]